MNLFASRIEALRTLMKREGVTVYLVPTSDYHDSEYIGDHFKFRSYLSGFTGSAGTLFVTLTEAGLFTDGRYFIQAEQELLGSGITLYRMGMEGVPTLEEKLCELLAKGGVFGFDGRLLSYAFLTLLKEKLNNATVTFRYDLDFATELWSDRPALLPQPAYRLAECYSGKSTATKLTELRTAIKSFVPDNIFRNGERQLLSRGKKYAANAYVLTTLDDIAWLFNLRGNDIPCNPVVFSYALLTETDTFLYIHSEALDKATEALLFAEGITIRPYDALYEDVKKLSASSVLLDTKRVNYALVQSLPEHCTLLDSTGPILLAKAIKNETEQKNMVYLNHRSIYADTPSMSTLR